MQLPCALYSVSQVRALDRYAIEECAVDAYTLMKRAGESALGTLRARWPTAVRIVVLAGGGNNGGDGYVLARFARAAGLEPCVLSLVPPAKLSGIALQACRDYLAGGGQRYAFEPGLLARAEVLVDALLGTGLEAPVRAPIATAIEAINASGHPVLALDLPSGLNGDSGAVMGMAVRADCTISFVGLKSGLFLGAGPEYAGRVHFDDLGVAAPARAQFVPRLERLSEALLAEAFPRRRRQAHKGEFGRVLIVGGAPGMPGAVRLAGEAALRVGAGLVTVATAPENLNAVAAGRPELILHSLDTAAALAEAVQAAEVIAVGPGLGQGAWSQAILNTLLDSGRPLIVDADALNLLARQERRLAAGSVITPHPGEASRLLGWETTRIQSERVAALDALTERYGAVCVLKGAGTLIGCPGRVSGLCERGNPGMASPGMGDVLTGAIAGALGQCRDPWLAARAAVLVHALAGDELARVTGERGILAGEVAEGLTRWVNLQ